MFKKYGPQYFRSYIIVEIYLYNHRLQASDKKKKKIKNDSVSTRNFRVIECKHRGDVTTSRYIATQDKRFPSDTAGFHVIRLQISIHQLFGF